MKTAESECKDSRLFTVRLCLDLTVSFRDIFMWNLFLSQPFFIYFSLHDLALRTKDTVY